MYKLYQFDGITLPSASPDDDISTGAVDAALIDVPGGAVDAWGATAKDPRKQIISQSGLVFGIDTYLVDESGNHILDDLGNIIAIGTAANMERLQVDALKRLNGRRATLTRKRLDDSVIHWKTARLLGVQHNQTARGAAVSLLRSTFETAMVGWRGATEQRATVTYPTGNTIIVTNQGDFQINDAVFAITVSSTVTAVQVTSTTGIDLRWTGSAAAGYSLVIDAGKQSVLLAGANAYSGFSLGTGHTVAGWLPLPVGNTTLALTITGAGLVEVIYYDQYA